MRSSGESANPPTLPTKALANQPAAPLDTTAWAKDNEVAITKKLLHAKSRSKSRQDSSPIPGNKITVMAISAGTAG